MADTQAAAVTADYQRFKDLTYDGFRALAAADGLSRYQRIGFPDSYREGHEAAIFRDVAAKLPALGGQGQLVVDIGPGCSDLPRLLVDACRRGGHTLVLCDSPEMLAHLPDGPGIVKVPGRFPHEADLAGYEGRVDVLVCYSVLHYVFAEQPVFAFLDRVLALLAPGGAALVGDIPNVSMRKRFFSSEAGARCHREFTGRDERPAVAFNCPEPGKLDDAAVLALVARARAAGCDAFLLPQAADLPLANRREDLLLRRP